MTIPPYNPLTIPVIGTQITPTQPNTYAADAWNKLGATDIGVVPAIPQEDTDMNQVEYELFYIPPTINGQNLNFSLIEQLSLTSQNIGYDYFNPDLNDWLSGISTTSLDNTSTDDVTPKFTPGWIAVSKYLINGSINRTPAEQEEIISKLGPGFRMLKTSEAVIITFLRKVCLKLQTTGNNPWTDTRTRDGKRYATVGLSSTGLYINNNNFASKGNGVYAVKSL